MDQQNLVTLSREVKAWRLMVWIGTAAAVPCSLLMYYLLYHMKIMAPREPGLLGPALIAWYWVCPIPFAVKLRAQKKKLAAAISDCDAGQVQ